MFRDKIEDAIEEHDFVCADRDDAIRKLDRIASLHSPDDIAICEECDKPCPCPTWLACG